MPEQLWPKPWVGDARTRLWPDASIGAPSSLDLGPVGHTAASGTRGLQPLLPVAAGVLVTSSHAYLLPIVGPLVSGMSI